jgi:hypothetical protein
MTMHRTITTLVPGLAALLAVAGAPAAALATPAAAAAARIAPVAPVAGVAGVAGVAVQADPADGSPERDPRILADLAAPDLATREAASRRLSTSRTLDPETVRALVARRNIPLEARFRLLAACYDTYVTAPLGALGVQHDPPSRGGRGVILRAVIAGFDAARKLRAQDRILSIDGVPMADTSSLARAVQRRRPGDVVEIVYQRPLRENDAIVRDELNQIVYAPPATTEVELGSFTALRSDDWSGRRQISEVPTERRTNWADALGRSGAEVRRLVIPTEATPATPEPDAETGRTPRPVAPGGGRP